jgi:hypothetical protein
LRHKFDLLADHVEIAVRKLDKEKNRTADLAMQIKKLEEKKSDDKLLDSLIIMVKRNNQVLEEQVDKKLSKEVWDRDSSRLSERLQIMSEHLHEKADKDEIRRAFQFIEDKIKEIVMLMAGDAQQEKEGAGRRLPFKCLSCDKDLDHSLPVTQRNLLGVQTPNRAAGSSNLRKRVRVTNLESR